MRFIRHFLLSPDDAGGSTPPPAAAIVSQGNLTEADAAELVRLRQQQADLEGKVKDREIRISELEHENHRLKGTAPAPKKGVLDALAEYFPS